MADTTLNPPAMAPARRWHWPQIDPVLAVCVAMGIVLLLLALLAPVLAPFDPDQQKLLARLKPPIGFDRSDPRYLLGTDQLGRDLLSRCLYGLRLSLLMAAFGALAGLMFGALMGMVAGLAGGVIDGLIMSICDVKLSLPFTLVALLVIAVVGTSATVLVLVLGLAYWAHFARLIRAQVLSLREQPAPRAGASPRGTYCRT
jgi:peptide/nickel transport system permease protein